MKRRGFTLIASMVIMATVFTMSFLSSCEGPAGVPGQDANETCIQCHNDETTVLAAMVQHSNSGHQTGSSFERNGTSCAPCHTHQGYLEILATGEQMTASDVSNPLPANCRTCHKIHENFDESDFELRNTSPVTLWINSEEVDLGTGNQCVDCHQPRIPDPMPEMGGGNVTITSSRWGPHHGTQSSMLWGTAGYEVAGSESFNSPGSHPHTSAGCNTCHMAEPFGAFAGGHSFSMSYEYHGRETEHLAGCQGCHQNIEEFDLNGASSEVETLMADLWAILLSNEYVDDESGLVNASSSTPLVIPSDHAGAILNYYMVIEDGSMGVHNPKYTKALLTNSIEVFN
ncbi:MAG: hypothetical protein ACP5E3_03505 [Bacteroidales bacterium]